MTSTTIGVVVATRDGIPFVEEQLRTILEGSVVPDEVVVSDDDSRDGTVGLAEEILRASGVRFRIVRNSPALGVARNVAAAVGMSSTDVVVLADQDDRWHEDRLEAVVRQFADPGVVLAHGDADLIDAAGTPLGATLFGRLEVTASDRAAISGGRAFETYLRRNLATGATMAIRRAAVGDALRVPEGWVHDEWFALVAASRGRVIVDERPLIDYRLHGRNQIGVSESTLPHKLRRVLTAEVGRNDALAEKFAALANYLAESGAPTHSVGLAREKASFEAARARLPRMRVLRVPAVIRTAARGEYARLASRGNWDIVRDLLQPR